MCGKKAPPPPPPEPPPQWLNAKDTANRGSQAPTSVDQGRRVGATNAGGGTLGGGGQDAAPTSSVLGG